MNTYEDRVRLIFRFIEEDLEGLAAYKHGTFRDLQKELATLTGISSRELTLDVLQGLWFEVRRKIIHPIASLNFRETREISRKDREEYPFPPSEPDASVLWVYHDGH